MHRINKQTISQALNALTVAAQECVEAFNQFDYVIKNNRIDLIEPTVLKNEKPYYRMNEKY